MSPRMISSSSRNQVILSTKQATQTILQAFARNSSPRLIDGSNREIKEQQTLFSERRSSKTPERRNTVGSKSQVGLSHRSLSTARIRSTTHMMQQTSLNNQTHSSQCSKSRSRSRHKSCTAISNQDTVNSSGRHKSTTKYLTLANFLNELHLYDLEQYSKMLAPFN